MRARWPVPHDRSLVLVISLNRFEDVTRRIRLSPSDLHRLLGSQNATDVTAPITLEPHGSFTYVESFAPVDGFNPPTWRARGRLARNGLGLVRHTSVDLEITPWSQIACELRMSPRSKRFRSWGAHRQRRYFVLAHQAADEIARRLGSANGEPRIVPIRTRPPQQREGRSDGIHRQAHPDRHAS